MSDDLDTGYSETTAIEDTDLIPVYKKSGDSLWRKLTGANLRKVSGTQTAGAFNSQSSNLSINDDAAASIEFGGDARGIVVIGSRNRSTGNAIIFVRVGSSPDTAILASDLSGGGAVAVTTGALTGTTGTDTNLTISAHTDNKMYIENRTGSSGNYQVSFLAMQGSDVSSL